MEPFSSWKFARFFIPTAGYDRESSQSSRSIREKLYEKKMALMTGREGRREGVRERAGVNGPRGKSRLANRAAAIAPRNFVRDACIFSLISLNSIWRGNPENNVSRATSLLHGGYGAGFANNGRSSLKRYHRFRCCETHIARPTRKCSFIAQVPAEYQPSKNRWNISVCLAIRCLFLVFAVQHVIRFNVKINKSYWRNTFWWDKKIVLPCNEKKQRRRKTLGNYFFYLLKSLDLVLKLQSV